MREVGGERVTDQLAVVDLTLTDRCVVERAENLGSLDSEPYRQVAVERGPHVEPGTLRAAQRDRIHLH